MLFYKNLFSVILWDKENSLTSLFKKPQVTKNFKNGIFLTSSLKSIIIGLLLSDGWMQKNSGWNPRFCLKQSIIHFDFLWSVFYKLAILCSNYPILVSNMMKGKKFNALTFQTRQLTCLNEIFELFYTNISHTSKKVIKYDLFFYLDYLAIAYWIMGDGSKRNKGITLCTDNFTIQEIV